MFTEMLEKRLLFATMTVTGTGGDDTIALAVSNGLVTAMVNGSPSAQTDFIVTDVTIDAQGGNDTILIQSNGANAVIVNAGVGDDVIQIAPGSRDLDSIGADITIDGGGGHDTATLFDDEHALGLAYQFHDGNRMRRAGETVFTFNTIELAHLEGGSNNNFYSFLAMPTLPLSLRHGGALGTLQIKGSGSENIVYKPDAAEQRKGILDLGAHDVAFDNFGSISCEQLANVQLITPNADDAIEITQVSSINNRVSGTSGGVNIVPLNFNSISGSFHMDLGLRDATGVTSTNSVTLSGDLIGSQRITVNAGIVQRTSVDLLTVNDGTWTLDLNPLSSRRRWIVTLNGVDTDVTFVPNETFLRLEVNGGATARLSGIGNDAGQLAAASGTGTIEVATGGLLEATNSFGIAASATLLKEGPGTLAVGPAATPAHGSGAVLDVQEGTVNLLGDAGTPSSRNLAVSSSATVNLFSTQHLAGVFADIGGSVNMMPAGDRVLVTEAVGVNTEGGVIDLHDNDMILDYSGPTPIENIRLLLRGGFAGGGWNGIGIASASAAAAGKTALGYAEATDLFSNFPATFSGEQVDDTSVLIKYTFYGDSNFDGQTNLADFNVLAANFGTNDKRWVRGDNDYNLQVNLADFNLLASAFGTSGLGRQSSHPKEPLEGRRSTASDILDELQR